MVHFCLHQHCTMPCGNRLCSLRKQKGWDRGRWVGVTSGWQCMAAVVIGCRKALAGTEWAISLPFFHKVASKMFLLPHRGSIPGTMGTFQSVQVFADWEPWLLKSLMSGCGLSHDSVHNDEKFLWVEFQSIRFRQKWESASIG